MCVEQQQFKAARMSRVCRWKAKIDQRQQEEFSSHGKSFTVCMWQDIFDSLSAQLAYRVKHDFLQRNVRRKRGAAQEVYAHGETNSFYVYMENYQRRIVVRVAH